MRTETRIFRRRVQLKVLFHQPTVQGDPVHLFSFHHRLQVLILLTEVKKHHLAITQQLNSEVQLILEAAQILAHPAKKIFIILRINILQLTPQTTDTNTHKPLVTSMTLLLPNPLIQTLQYKTINN